MSAFPDKGNTQIIVSGYSEARLMSVDEIVLQTDCGAEFIADLRHRWSALSFEIEIGHEPDLGDGLMARVWVSPPDDSIASSLLKDYQDQLAESMDTYFTPLSEVSTFEADDLKGVTFEVLEHEISPIEGSWGRAVLAGGGAVLDMVSLRGYVRITRRA